MTIDIGRSPSGRVTHERSQQSPLPSPPTVSVPNAVSLLFDASDLCERSDGPDRRLDAMIAKALGLPHGRDSGWCNGDNGDYWVVEECAKPFTASLDAAMTIAPGVDWEWSLEWETDSDGEMFARCAMGDPARHPDCEAKTLPLAFCTAALRAHAASAIEAQRAATAQTGAVHESAVAESQTPTTEGDS